MKKKITLEFNSVWVLSRQNDEVLPVKFVISKIKEICPVQILDDSITSCELLIDFSDESKETAQLIENVSKIIADTYSISDVSQVLDYTVSDYADETESANTTTGQVLKVEENTPSVQTATIEKTAVVNADKLETVLSKINSLVGADEFKALVNECVSVAPMLKKHNTVNTFLRRSYIFSVNNGNGFSTYIELFADLLEALNLVKLNERARIVEEKANVPSDRGSELEPFSGILNHVMRHSQQDPKVICVDISEWMSKVDDKAFRLFLSVLDDHVGENIIIFKVPFVEKEILRKIEMGIADLLFVKSLSFVPFDCAELRQCAKNALTSMGFEIEDDAWKIFEARITEEKSDGRFYGINTVNKIICEMIYYKHLHNAQNDIDDVVIKKDEILELVASFEDDEKSGIEMLDDYIGMEGIKTRVEEIVAQIEMSIKNKSLSAPCLHMRFVGNPGTGKTTVARIIGKILKERGVLRNGNFFEYTGRDFCGRFVGETAPKTAAMCRDAYGSILFIDEAYALYRGDGISNADYGREAIDTLIAEMENHRSDLVVIMAGYTQEMNQLMKANVGLESRMPYVIEFPNYTREQLFEIFMLQVKKSFECCEGFENVVKNYFDSISDEVLESKEFSNARFVRNLFERTWGKAVLRTQLNKEEKTILTNEDFFLASSEKEFSEILKKETQTLGFI